MACRSCDLKRIYRLFEEKKRREAEEAEERARREAEDAGGRTHKRRHIFRLKRLLSRLLKLQKKQKQKI